VVCFSRKMFLDIYSNFQLCQGGPADYPWFRDLLGVRQGCVVASALFLEPMDWPTNCAAHNGYYSIPEKMLVEDLHSNTFSCARVDGDRTMV